MTENFLNQDERARTYLGVENTAITKLALAVAVLVIGIFVWALADAVSAPLDTTASVLAVLGFLLTGGALAVAMLVFQVQRQDSRDQAIVTSVQLAGLRDQLAEMAHAHSSAEIEADLAAIAESPDDADQGDQEDVDSTEAPSETLLLAKTLRALGVSDEKLAGIEPFRGSDIPLRPLSILRSGLASNPSYARVVEGDPDQIKPRDLAAYRRTGVRGPSTWFLVVPTAPGRGRGADARRGRSVWKVSLLTDQIERLDEPS
ncbi:hypothetical protein [Nocardioides aurantiacus]|uniref:Uncharacterized protein n=1 Tax=Nocardioides aurantiacus TaxID=86796 RepID=A0A3N2CV50_9ACTN|nr:hypothetical protein [Nocardioides aurantiacus]ROR91104.1 hypothetical protein EDD33_1965 [Nocardioides aurantiacus]